MNGSPERHSAEIMVTISGPDRISVSKIRSVDTGFACSCLDVFPLLKTGGLADTVTDRSLENLA